MIRPVTCVLMMMAAGSGLYVYQAKHQAQLETREIRRLLSETDATRKDTGLLIAEYARESDPERLGDFVKRFLPQLRPTQPTQFTTFADLDTRLPPVSEQQPAEQAPLEPDVPFQIPQVVAPSADANGGEAGRGRPAYGPPAPEAPVPMPPTSNLMASASPTPTQAAPTSIAKTEPKPEPSRPTQVAAAGRLAEPSPRASEAPAHPAAPRVARSAVAAASPVTTQFVSAIRPAVQPQTGGYLAPGPGYQPVQLAPPPMVGSALGMARTMPQADPYYTPSGSGLGGSRN
jgi:hypothetical protein